MKILLQLNDCEVFGSRGHSSGKISAPASCSSGNVSEGISARTSGLATNSSYPLYCTTFMSVSFQRNLGVGNVTIYRLSQQLWCLRVIEENADGVTVRCVSPWCGNSRGTSLIVVGRAMWTYGDDTGNTSAGHPIGNNQHCHCVLFSCPASIYTANSRSATNCILTALVLVRYKFIGKVRLLVIIGGHANFCYSLVVGHLVSNYSSHATYYILGAKVCFTNILQLGLARDGGGDVQPLRALEITEIWINSASVIQVYQTVLSTISGILKSEEMGSLLIAVVVEIMSQYGVCSSHDDHQWSPGLVSSLSRLRIRCITELSVSQSRTLSHPTSLRTRMFWRSRYLS